jgi:hypothetical protein
MYLSDHHKLDYYFDVQILMIKTKVWPKVKFCEMNLFGKYNTSLENVHNLQPFLLGDLL